MKNLEFMYFELPLQSQAIHYGSLAQLVQSVCLTSRGSGVRIPQLPPNESSRLQQCKRLFHEREHSSVGLERLLDKQEVSGSNPLVPTNPACGRKGAHSPFPAVFRFILPRFRIREYAGMYVRAAGVVPIPVGIPGFRGFVGRFRSLGRCGRI